MKLTNEPERITELSKIINDESNFSSKKSQQIIKSEVDYFLNSNQFLKEFIINLSEKISYDYMSYPVMIRNIIKVRNFTLVRYQDGEWTCMLKIEPHFSNKIPKYGSEIGPLGDVLLNIIKETPDYFISVNAGTFYERAGLVWPYIKNLKNLFVGEIFRNVSVNKGLDDFIEVLRDRKVILVGPDWLKKLKGFDREHVITPFGTLFKKNVMDKLELDVETLIEKYKKDNPVILYSCSFPGKIMSDKFYKKYSNTITQIDMGATWDPYCGKQTRPYHEKVINRIEKK